MIALIYLGPHWLLYALVGNEQVARMLRTRLDV
jgi:hypothetical protein